jgi:Leucine-rich repeat (LRR) protein
MTPEEGYREAERRIAETHTSSKILPLCDLQLTKIPPQIASLFQLQYLDLTNNQIVEIPDVIAQLSQLQYLYFSNNKIVEIPEAITQLSNLRELNLSNNPLNPTLAAVYQQGLPELKKYGSTRPMR